MDKNAIIRVKLEGHSNREAAKILGIDRKTIARYWNQYEQHQKELNDGSNDITVIQEMITEDPKYDSSNRKPRKFTEEIDTALNEILRGEQKKNRILGTHKQWLTRQQMHQMLIQQGFDISYTTHSQ